MNKNEIKQLVKKELLDFLEQKIDAGQFYSLLLEVKDWINKILKEIYNKN